MNILRTAVFAIGLTALIGIPSTSVASTIRNTPEVSRAETRGFDLAFAHRASAHESRPTRSLFRSFARAWNQRAAIATGFDTNPSEFRRSLERRSRQILLRGNRGRGHRFGEFGGGSQGGVIIAERPRPIITTDIGSPAGGPSGPVGAVPEPTAALLFGAGVLVAGSVTRQRR